VPEHAACAYQPACAYLPARAEALSNLRRLLVYFITYTMYTCTDKLKGKGSPYSITERRVPQLIPILGSQPAGYVSHKPGGRLPLFPPGTQLPLQPLRGLLPILLFGKQRHDGCEQFA